jgi:hypothetical protein
VSADRRECGWNGCGHPRCALACDGVPLDVWERWDRERERVALYPVRLLPGLWRTAAVAYVRGRPETRRAATGWGATQVDSERRAVSRLPSAAAQGTLDG